MGYLQSLPNARSLMRMPGVEVWIDWNGPPVGTPLQLMVRGKALPAKVAAMPFAPHRYHR